MAEKSLRRASEFWNRADRWAARLQRRSLSPRHRLNIRLHEVAEAQWRTPAGDAAQAEATGSVTRPLLLVTIRLSAGQLRQLRAPQLPLLPAFQRSSGVPATLQAPRARARARAANERDFSQQDRTSLLFCASRRQESKLEVEVVVEASEGGAKADKDFYPQSHSAAWFQLLCPHKLHSLV